MNILLEDPALDSHIQKLAQAYGHTVDEMMKAAVRDAVGRLASNAPRRIDLEEVRRLQDELAKLPILDHRSDDEIIGYNELGHFD